MTATNPTPRSGLAWQELPRLLVTPAAPNLGAHLERFGSLPPSAGLIAEVERSGLRGRGGAGFPTAVKLAAVARGRRTIVVANGTEGEPASAKDKVLLAHAPHLVLDGAVLAAAAVGAREVIVCVERSAAWPLQVLGRALSERRRAQIDPIPIRLEATPNRYITGEESALVHWLNGGEAKPTFVPPRPYERGVAGRPTLIQNVETLAHLALIARYGAEWFRALGTASDPGTALVTISGALARPGVYEVPLGAPLRDVLGGAGASPADIRAVLVGGYFGTWIPAGILAEVDLTAESLRWAGASLGCGVLAVLPVGTCGLAESARVTRWLCDQSAGQCGPCVSGLGSIAWAMDVLVRGDINGQAERQLGRWLTMVKGRGACRHPDGVVRLVESCLRVFGDEIALHRHRGPCPPAPAALLPVPMTGSWR